VLRRYAGTKLLARYIAIWVTLYKYVFYDLLSQHHIYRTIFNLVDYLRNLATYLVIISALPFDFFIMSYDAMTSASLKLYDIDDKSSGRSFIKVGFQLP